MGLVRWIRPGGLIALLVFACAASARAQEAEPPPAAPAQQPAEPSAKPPSPDGRRTTARFFVNFGRNMVGVFSRDSLKPLLIGAALTGVATAFDDDVHGYFAPKRRAKWLGDAVDFEGQPKVLIPLGLGIYGAGRLAHSQRFRDATYDIAQAMAVDTVYFAGLKAVTRRYRPDSTTNRQSFPSGHTSDAFAWATVAAHYYSFRLSVPAYLVAGLIGVGRLENNAHHLSDVVAGATLGVIIGRSVVRKDSEPARAPRVSLAPSRDAYGTGLGLALHLDF